MPITELDLVLRADGKPVVVGEVKSRPVAPEFRTAIREQLRMLAQRTGSPWLVLVDPDLTRVYQSDDIDVPVAQIPTSQVLESAGLSEAQYVGESVLTLALERWLQALENAPQFVQRFPDLARFVADVGQADESLQWVSIG